MLNANELSSQTSLFPNFKFVFITEEKRSSLYFIPIVSKLCLI